VSSNASTHGPLYSGELARLAGVSTDTLRFYERRGLLASAPRSQSGYRLYPAEAVSRIRLIRGALSIGFSVNELAAIFRERDHGGAPCHRVRDLAAEKLVALEAQLRDLQSWRRVLRKTLAGWDRVLRKTPLGKRAGLLEAFVATHPTRQERISRFDVLARGIRKQEKQR
jgi:DNA-binding transcriptional MerR regulator